ncbi:hypothetical protein SELMODRAFT_430421 [Selaginella moellendorffii]|uniref:Uncharacterized protein n=1 Tax=Selaginella moellendorffii TaxID=88036 RepID=D8T9D0_SELML|nr:hypothetical protein SELMODRAFT_430421 [Selaginella moellendorffii]
MAATTAAAALGGEISMTNKTRRREVFAARSSNASPKSGNQALCCSKGSPTYIQEFESRSSADEVRREILSWYDLGLTYNSSATVDHVIRNDPSLLLMVGDLTYSDQYITNGTGSPCFSCAFPDAPIRETYHPQGRFMEEVPTTRSSPGQNIQGQAPHALDRGIRRGTIATAPTTARSSACVSKWRSFSTMPASTLSNGHVHAYERMNRVTLTSWTRALHHAANQFCWDRQPEWSTLRDGSFGHGLLEVKNWYRNQDVYGDSHLGDIVKSLECRNYPAFQADERSGGNSGSPSRILGALAILMATLLEF